LVGGFPCQDYSVAKSLSQSKGITGKKGVLWWEIHRILKDINHRPEFILLENSFCKFGSIKYFYLILFLENRGCQVSPQ